MRVLVLPGLGRACVRSFLSAMQTATQPNPVGRSIEPLIVYLQNRPPLVQPALVGLLKAASSSPHLTKSQSDAVFIEIGKHVLRTGTVARFAREMAAMETQLDAALSRHWGRLRKAGVQARR